MINSQNPDGNTPTGPSIDQVVADFAANPPPTASPPVIVLATDGLQHVQRRQRHRDRPGQAMANVQNGQPNAPYYPANSPQQLTDAFDQIIGGATSRSTATSIPRRRRAAP